MELQCSHAAQMEGPAASSAGCAALREKTPTMNQHAGFQLLIHSNPIRFIIDPIPDYMHVTDVFAHLTCASYQGEEGRVSDLEHVLERARNAGVSHIISACEELQHALNLLKMSRAADEVYCTISLDPGVLRGKGTRAPYLREVRRLAEKYRGVVVGVMRLQRALGVAVDQQLPLYFKWNRKKVSKLILNFKELLQLLPTTIIYSFEGSKQDAQTLLNNGFYIGISCRFAFHFFLLFFSCFSIPIQCSFKRVTKARIPRPPPPTSTTVATQSSVNKHGVCGVAGCCGLGADIKHLLLFTNGTQDNIVKLSLQKHVQSEPCLPGIRYNSSSGTQITLWYSST
ncbi:putative deoxyribonuclease TATDN1 [Portunus trituberculatus]|uniref:Putative deoxyribonuclease TATDN1 n=1 Tax=Portunus trituberculatus TaxID=210409 RepID=A0A5B7D067_PORTR|nr:putative deoxyribonuclease TATDN1 [Portunus trituberculatus]